MRTRTSDRGASTLELVLYMPLLFFAIFVTVQTTMLFLGNQAANAAAREAARVARTGGGSPAALAAAEARGRDYAASIGSGVLEDTEVRVRVVDGGRQIEVTVTGQGIRVVPGAPGLNIDQVVQGPIEQFRPDE